jgi:hypothetical protein
MRPFRPRLTPVAEWDFDQHGALKDILKDRHPLQGLSLRDSDLLKEFLVLNGKDVDALEGLARLPDARPFEAEFCPLQRMIQDQNLLGPRLDAGLGQSDDDQRVGRRGEVGRLGERHVGLDDHPLPLLDEPGEASHRLQGLPGGRGRLAGNHGEIDLLGRAQERRIACQADRDACRGGLQELPS